MGEKITGYFLLFTGLALVIFSLFNVYLVFTRHSKPVQFFNLEAISLDYSKIAGNNVLHLQDENIKTEILPKEALNTSLNLIAHLFLMGFVGSTGFKISHIGTLLIRPIKVTLKKDLV